MSTLVFLPVSDDTTHYLVGALKGAQIAEQPDRERSRMYSADITAARRKLMVNA